MWNDTVRLILFMYNNTCNDIIPISKLTVAMEVMVHLLRSLSYDWLLSMVFFPSYVLNYQSSSIYIYTHEGRIIIEPFIYIRIFIYIYIYTHIKST